MTKPLDLIDQKFNRLTCIRKNGRDRHGNVIWVCRCECGKDTTVTATDLRSGNTKSCGCLSRELASKNNKTHGLSYNENGAQPKIYMVWNSMKQRCFNPKNRNYKYYGGRGITVCKEWMDFKNFYGWSMATGYQEGLTIERINNDGDYQPSNCSWIPKSKQSENRANCHLITWRGQTKPLSEWSKVLGIGIPLLIWRIRKWGVEKALTAPIKNQGGKI